MLLRKRTRERAYMSESALFSVGGSEKAPGLEGSEDRGKTVLGHSETEAISPEGFGKWRTSQPARVKRADSRAQGETSVAV